MRTLLYINGGNLYNSAGKRTPLRCLSSLALVARISPRNPNQPVRQLRYWRALSILPDTQGLFHKPPTW